MPRALKFAISSLLIGLMSVGLAYAGAILNPGGGVAAPTGQTAALTGSQKAIAALETTTADPGTVAEPGPGQVLAGAAKANIAPRPTDFGGTEWRREGCDAVGPGVANADPTDFRVRWLESSNCIYAGGYDIGPMNPIARFDEEHGLWARSVVVSDGADSLIMTILDGAYYFGEYANMCGSTSPADDPTAAVDDPRNDCGFFDIQQDMGAELGVDPSSFMLASTHAHAAPDFVGAWGGVPQWYMDQVEAAIKSSIRAAWAMRRPAVIEVGDQLARQFNNDRRDAYRSGEENSFSWFRLLEPGPRIPDEAIAYNGDGTFSFSPPPGSDTNGGGQANGCENGGATGNPLCLRAIATVGSYAAHPTGDTGDDQTASSDWMGPFNSAVEQEFGGVGLMFDTGLGNMSRCCGTGQGLAALLPELATSDVLENPEGPIDVSTQQTFWNQPVTNTVLAGGGASGVFDRPMSQVPATVRAGKNIVEQCVSASPISVRTAASVARVGSLVVTGGPGELFSNLTNTIKEKNPNGVTMPLALVNDALGYIMQSFETDHAGRQGAGFGGSPVGIEYEDAYSIDHCFGDMVLEVTLDMMGVDDANWVSVPPQV